MLSQESDVYDRAKVDIDTGEIEEFDTAIFNGIVRPREVGFVSGALNARNGMRVLDLGCGGGWMTRTLVHMGHNPVGVDVSRGILVTASKVAGTKGRLVRADGHNLPFTSSAFDAVVCVGALHHTDLERLLPEVKRTVKRDGILVFLEPNRFNPFSAIGRRLFPMETHTPGEEPYGPRELRRELRAKGWIIDKYQTVFLYALALSYVLHKLKWIAASDMVADLVDRHERRLERWFSLVPAGAVILGTARPESPESARAGSTK